MKVAPPDLVARLVNCPITGDDVLHLQLSGFIVELHQASNSRDRALEGQLVHTTDVIIREVLEDRKTEALSVVTALNWLLAFVTMSQVHTCGRKYGLADLPGWARGILIRSRPVVNLDDGTAVRRFIETTWDGYRKLEQKRKLPLIIDYVTQAEGYKQASNGDPAIDNVCRP